MEEYIKQIEAILFSCGREIEVSEIAKLTGIGSEGTVQEILEKIREDYDKRESPMMLVPGDSAWKMTVREKYLKVVRKITPYMEFPKTIMETLAVIAWKQPIMQSDVIRIRTNKAYEHIGELEKMGFLSKEKHGRSFLIRLSQKFYDYFDLRDDVDVRNLFKNVKDEEPEQKKMGEYAEPVEAGDVSEKAESTQEEDTEDMQEKSQSAEPEMVQDESDSEHDEMHEGDAEDSEPVMNQDESVAEQEDEKYSDKQ